MNKEGKPKHIKDYVLGKYIYSIIQDSNPPATLPSASPMGPYENRSFGPIGINNREVKLVPYKDISAVVSPTPIINFDRLDKKELTRHVATHQQVNEEMMKEYDVVPMTFGIIAPSVDEVLRILEKAYLQFKTALKNIAGKAEFAVQVWWDPKKLLEELANTNPEIRKLKQKVALKGSPEGPRPFSEKGGACGVNILGMPINPVRGQRGLAERQREQTSNGVKLKLGKLIQKEAEIQRQTFINDIHASLRNLSLDSTSNKLIDDEMIANFSFLIEKPREPELDKKMQEFGKKYEGKLRFKYIGPMPSYSFININLGLGNFELVNEARKLLGLGEEATFDEIKKAYYELAHKYHPDKFQGGEEQMKKIAHAYSILENYYESCDEFSPSQVLHNKIWEGKGQKTPHQSKHGTGQGHKYSFKKEDVENSLIIEN